MSIAEPEWLTQYKQRLAQMSDAELEHEKGLLAHNKELKIALKTEIARRIEASTTGRRPGLRT